jgi:mono/diheme cytochrome c family protein
MPYTCYTKLSRDDVLAIRAYLKTVPAVHNAVKSNQLPFPFNVRASLAGWDALFFKPGAFKPVTDKGAEWNRGAYLVEGASHCGMCHTPKNTLGGDKNEPLQGYALQGWFAPNITNDDRLGLGTWTADDVAEYLKTGHNRFSAASGPMGEVVTFSTAQMTDADLHAMAVYLKGGAAQKPKTPVKADAMAVNIGGKIYADECSGCHGRDGKGTPGLFPALAGSPAVRQDDATSLMRVILRGARSVGTDEAPTAPAMPSFGWVLDDGQVADLLTYVRNTWGNASSPVTADDVGKARHALAKRRD